MADPFVFESMDLFAPVMAAAPQDRAELYSDPDFRAAFKEKAGVHRRTMAARWPRTVVSSFPPDPSMEERSVVELADERGIDPTDLVLDLALESDLQARFRMAVLNTDEDEVAELLVDPNTMLGLSDAGAHASQLCDASFSTHLLGHWVRDKGVLTLEEAVHKLTQQPAEVFGLTDRGLLAEGRPADVVVFDPRPWGRPGCGGSTTCRLVRTGWWPTPMASTPSSSTAGPCAETASMWSTQQDRSPGDSSGTAPPPDLSTATPPCPRRLVAVLPDGGRGASSPANSCHTPCAGCGDEVICTAVA